MFLCLFPHLFLVFSDLLFKKTWRGKKKHELQRNVKKYLCSCRNKLKMCITSLIGRPLFCFLNEQIKHLRLHKLFHKVASVFGLQSFIEIPLLELSRLLRAFPHDVFSEVSDRLHEKWQERFRNYTI